MNEGMRNTNEGVQEEGTREEGRKREWDLRGDVGVMGSGEERVFGGLGGREMGGDLEEGEIWRRGR